MRAILLITLIISAIWTKPNAVDVESIIKESYKEDVNVTRDKIILSKSELSSIKEMAKLPIKSKLYRYYKVKQNDKVLGYGVLISQKVRTKKATVLYFIENGEIKFTEILAFLEPKEYIPKDVWMRQFDDKNISDPFQIGKDFPTISGATLSARSITDGARLAIALYNTKLK